LRVVCAVITRATKGLGVDNRRHVPIR
jgi:hypothetical protein